MQDPYEVLGVPRHATEAAIRSAYRKLAKKHHPDLNPGKPEAAERFKAISAANELLSDPAKRARFDRGEIDASGAERPAERSYYRDFSDDPGRTRYRGGADLGPDDLEELLAQAFGRGAAGGERSIRMRGADQHYSLTVDFVEAARGGSKRLTLPDGRTLDVTIPPGTNDGAILRLRGQGAPGIGGGPTGDAMIEIGIAPHPYFQRDGNDIVVELPVTLKEAVLGAAIAVPTIAGPVKLRIPKGSGTGTRLRLKDRGIGAGHQYVDLKVVIPPGAEPALERFLENWVPEHAFDPRVGMDAA